MSKSLLCIVAALFALCAVPSSAQSSEVGLQALASGAGKKWVRGVVIYTGTEVIPFANNLHGIPVRHLWAG